MHGNVAEWCADSEKASPQAVRGGSWQNPAEVCRAAERMAPPPSRRGTNLGLRLARALVSQESK
jgi:formylglycine-generating enzyme required for sulfatase activity